MSYPRRLGSEYEMVLNSNLNMERKSDYHLTKKSNKSLFESLLKNNRKGTDMKESGSENVQQNGVNSNSGNIYSLYKGRSFMELLRQQRMLKGTLANGKNEQTKDKERNARKVYEFDEI